jgi:hypothetical protein
MKFIEFYRTGKARTDRYDPCDESDSCKDYTEMNANGRASGTRMDTISGSVVPISCFASISRALLSVYLT